MVAGANLHLDRLGLGDVGFGLYLAALFLSLVLEFTIFHYFRNRRHRIGAYLDKVEPDLLCSGNSLAERQNAQVFALRAYDADLLRTNLVVNAGGIQVAPLYHDARKTKAPTSQPGPDPER
jgi:hypothetical protein